MLNSFDRGFCPRPLHVTGVTPGFLSLKTVFYGTIPVSLGHRNVTPYAERWCSLPLPVIQTAWILALQQHIHPWSESRPVGLQLRTTSVASLTYYNARSTLILVEWFLQLLVPFVPEFLAQLDACCRSFGTQPFLSDVPYCESMQHSPAQHVIGTFVSALCSVPNALLRSIPRVQTLKIIRSLVLIMCPTSAHATRIIRFYSTLAKSFELPRRRTIPL